MCVYNYYNKWRTQPVYIECIVQEIQFWQFMGGSNLVQGSTNWLGLI